MSIPASEVANVIPGVLSPGGNPLSLNAVMLTNSTRVPIGVVQAFEMADDVRDFFEPSSIEATLAAKYFAGFNNATSLPSVLYFAQYNSAAVAAYLRTGSFSGTTLAQLQALSGTLIVVVDGITVTSANIDLSTATSFTNAAALIQAGLQTAGGIFSGSATIDDGGGLAGNTLTITVVTTGAVHVGDPVVGVGIAPSTTITAFGTGTGGLGTYTVSGAAQLVDPAVAITVSSTATVSYDSQLARFLITSSTTGDDSTIGYATGTLSVGLKFTAATGAQLSQGADAATPADFMPTITLATQNWATFMTVFEPVTAEKLLFAAWVQTTNNRFAYVAWDSDVTVLEGVAPTSFGAQVTAAEMDGIYPRYEPATDDGNGRKAAFICGSVASIDFAQPNGRITFAFKGQSGLVADITNASAFGFLKANGYNGYCAFATANDRFVNEQSGSTPGQWRWFDAYVNQIWLNAELQLAGMTLLTQINSIPYNAEGVNLQRAAYNDTIQRALINGVIQSGVTLSNAQRAQINTAANVAGAADAVQNNGYYLQILIPAPEVRVVRGPMPATLWYTDGGSVQSIELSSIDVQ
jgi:hypothetical protein